MKLKKIPILLVLASLFSTVSCGNGDDSSKYSKNIFFSEIYSGDSINDVVIEIGTNFETSFSLEGFKLNIYDSKKIIKTHEFSNETISSNDLILFANKDATYKNDELNIITLEDNYLDTIHGIELLDPSGKIVDCLGDKLYYYEYLEKGSFLKLNEYMKGFSSFDPLHFVEFKENYTSNLGKLTCPITLEEIKNGPILEENYINTAFINENTATNGVTSAELKTLGDGDTTHFLFPGDIPDDYENRVRYLLINTPEIAHSAGEKNEPYGLEAKEYNNTRLKNATSILVQSCKDEGLHDVYGRTLGFVWYSEVSNPKSTDYKLLNFELVREGLARLTSGKYPTLTSKDVPYTAYFKYVNRLAEKNKINIFSK